MMVGQRITLYLGDDSAHSATITGFDMIVALETKPK